MQLQRIKKLQQQLKQKKLDALLVTNPTNIRYLTGFVGSSPTDREAYVVVTKKATYFLTSRLYPQWLRGEKNSWLNGLELNFENKLSHRLQEIAQKDTLKTIGFEENDVTVGELKRIKTNRHSENLFKKEDPSPKLRMTWKPTKNLIEELRLIKDAEEIENIKKAARLTDEAFEYIMDYLRDSSRLLRMTFSEQQIAWEIEKYIREKGAELAFSPIVAFGKNSAIPHHQPSLRLHSGQAAISRQLSANTKSENVVLIDFGAKVNGYCADMTRMVYVGKPSKKVKQQYTSLLKAQEKALEYLSKKTVFFKKRQSLSELSGKKADEIVRREMEKDTLPACPHSLGHGVGLNIHEGFRLTRKKDFVLKPNMVCTIEPGFYIPNNYGMRIEDLVLLTNTGIDVLSKSRKELIVI